MSFYTTKRSLGSKLKIAALVCLFIGAILWYGSAYYDRGTLRFEVLGMELFETGAQPRVTGEDREAIESEGRGISEAPAPDESQQKPSSPSDDGKFLLEEVSVSPPVAIGGPWVLAKNEAESSTSRLEQMLDTDPTPELRENQNLLESTFRDFESDHDFWKSHSGDDRDREEKKPGFFVYKVQTGDTLWDIADKYDIDIDTIVGANQDLGNMDHIEVGMELRILATKGVIHEVQSGQSLSRIAKLYEVDKQEIVKKNHIVNPDDLRAGRELIIPGGTPLPGQQISRASADSDRKNFIWPLRGYISSPFGPRWGRMHHGIDIAVQTGTTVRASANGRVVFTGWRGGYGRTVILSHGEGVETLYAHNSRITVSEGDFVYQGQQIALSGNSGNSTGPHLHFEVRIDGQPRNPKDYLP